MAYQQLTMSDRALIQIGREKGFSMRAIARGLGRQASTISRELKRNVVESKAYNLGSADKLARRRRSEHQRLRLLRDKELQVMVDKLLRKGWSPEQISGRLAAQSPQWRISFGAIYRYVRWTKKNLPKKVGWFRRCPAKRRKKSGSHFLSSNKKHMSERPEIANTRGEAGHWEGDTIVSSPGRPALLVYVDRKTRFVIIRKVESGKSEVITRETITALYGAGKRNRKTITLDNGKEFSGYLDFQRRLKMPTYFCRPHSPWERPTVENTNGLIRQLTRKKDLRKLTQKQVDKLVQLLNERPRKCLNWKTPAEEFG